MDSHTLEQLYQWARKFNTSEFIADDPVQFPHRFKEHEDIEISAFLTSWISYGNRRAIIRKGEELDAMFDGSPYSFICNRKYNLYKNDKRSFYRFYKYEDLYGICERLAVCYQNYGTLQNAVKASLSSGVIRKVQDTFSGVTGIPDINGNSACKRLSMFLRWMIRRDGKVDLGIWNGFSPCDLLIPLDTHVHQVALELGITSRRCADMKTAIEITEYMKNVFPEDPCLGDFALFGYGISR